VAGECADVGASAMARARGGRGYKVVGKADERGPLRIDCEHEGWVRGCGWQGRPADRGRGGTHMGARPR
jgi:hypothetical protein